MKIICPICEWSGKAREELSEKWVSCPHCAGQFQAYDMSKVDGSSRVGSSQKSAKNPLKSKPPVKKEKKQKQPGSSIGSHSEPSFKSIPTAKKSKDQFGRYKLIRELSRGSYGVVYLGMDPELGREVAIKVLIAGQHASDEDLTRFRGEAQAAARLRHKNIVAVHELGEIDGNNFITFEYVKGKNLADIVAQKPLPQEVVRLIQQVAQGVQHAHDHGIIHRDLKPGNVLIDKFGNALVTDFGLARSNEEQSSYTQAGDIIGTPKYMSPEQAEGKVESIDERSDLYSIGVMMYELLTGKLPFVQESLPRLLADIVETDPVSPRKLNPKIDPDLDTIILKCMEKRKQKRYRSISALLEDLRRYENGEPIMARPPSMRDFFIKWINRNRATAVAVIGAVFVLFGVTGWYIKNLNEERNIAQDARNNAEDARNIAEDALAKKIAAEEAQKNDRIFAADALVSRAREFIHKREFKKAINNVDAAMVFNPNLNEAVLLKAQLSIHQRDFETAVSNLDQYAKRKPDDGLSKRLLALCKKAHNNPDDSPPFDEIGSILVKQNMVDLATDLTKTYNRLFQMYYKKLRAAYKGSVRLMKEESGEFSVYLEGNLVRDLTPLKGLKIKVMHLDNLGISSLDPLMDMPLRSLIVERCGNVKSLAGLNNPSLEKLCINGLGDLRDITAIQNLPIKELELRSCKRISDLAPLRKIPLQNLKLHFLDSLMDLGPLKGAGIKQLSIRGCRKVHSLEPLKGMRLEELEIANCSKVGDLKVLTGMPLKSLKLEGLALITSLAPVKGNPLQEVSLENTSNIRDFGVLKGMPIKRFSVRDAANLTNLNFLKGAPLESIKLEDCRKLKDVSSLKGKGVQSLTILRCREISSLQFLQGMKKLESIHFNPSRHTDISVLKTLPKLNRINPFDPKDIGSIMAIPELSKKRRDNKNIDFEMTKNAFFEEYKKLVSNQDEKF